MKYLNKNFLRIILFVDFLITTGFGVSSWLFPHKTFGTIISIPEVNEYLFLSLLANLSMFYVVIGLVCLMGTKARFPISNWIGAIMIIRHLMTSIMGTLDLGKEWIIGNPYPDLIIQSIFICAYIGGIFWAIRLKKLG